jgi:hypothetical protein
MAREQVDSEQLQDCPHLEAQPLAACSVQKIHSSPQAIFHKTPKRQIRMAAAEHMLEVAAASPLLHGICCILQ